MPNDECRMEENRGTRRFRRFLRLNLRDLWNLRGKMTNAQAIKEDLANQILSCVQWQRSVENMIASGITTFFEIGHGNVLAGLIKRINTSMQVVNISDT